VKSVKKVRRLEELESELKPLLLSCLEECADGRWGLFGQNDHVDPDHRYSRWPEADHLKEIACEIQSMRAEFGQPNLLCERFLHYCSLKGSNVPGEPKLARAFLNEISSI
jgi:hypothetical protein